VSKDKPILFSAPMVLAILAGQKTQTRRVVKLPHQNPLGVWEPHRIGGPNGGRTRDGKTIPETGAIWHTRTGESLFYGLPGDRLWVRETWAHHVHAQAALSDDDGPWVYAADGEMALRSRLGDRWRPSIFMPRCASRITLEVKDTRVERLQDISEADAIAEGCKAQPFPGPWWQGYRRMDDGEIVHQQAIGEQPPEWMVEPHRMKDCSGLNLSAVDAYRALWSQIHGYESWKSNPFVWVIVFERVQA
jgi:hypothetical protein